ncbi:MAG: folate-binding protein YgfZ [Elusimicrobia bacterium]|nr:folate-binding protein YgfZ [Elusimicrobiota bacterium]MDE2314070.1 folate-binding protein YgfZ [Elusimicrobiota bacterium]
MMASEEALAQYRAAREGAAFAVFADWGVLRFAGPERMKFLQGLMTSDVAALAPGQNGWSCLLTAKGRIRAHALLLAREQEILALGPGAALRNMAEDFGRVILLSQTTMSSAEDLSAPILLLGPGAADLAARVPAALDVLAARDERFSPPGTWLPTPKDRSEKILAALQSAGAARLGAEAFEMLRLESGVAAFGRELGEEVFPQEARLEAEVSLNKGCYLGQEIMSRLSRRGHVNRLLVRLKLAGPEVPAAGTKVLVSGRESGSTAGAAYSPREGAALAFAFLRREDAAAGTRAELVGGRPAEII